jgi:hypothetical protein
MPNEYTATDSYLRLNLKEALKAVHWPLPSPTHLSTLTLQNAFPISCHAAASVQERLCHPSLEFPRASSANGCL